MVGIARNALSLLFLGLSTELAMLFVSRALAGVLSSATLPTAMAYIGDSTTEEERGGGMGMMGAGQVGRYPAEPFLAKGGAEQAVTPQPVSDADDLA